MKEYLSTTELGWVLGRSSGSIRTMIRNGEIAGVRLPGGYRIPRDEVLRVSREQVEEKTRRKLDDAALERLIDEVIETDRARTSSSALAQTDERLPSGDAHQCRAWRLRDSHWVGHPASRPGAGTRAPRS